MRPALRGPRAVAIGGCDRHATGVSVPARSTRRDPWNELSGAERVVAVLAAAGWTNVAIADRRGTSVRTTEAQLAAVLRKLVIGSRREIIEFVPDELLPDVRYEAGRRAPRRRRYHRIRT
ncbi:helix-turn-helix domain-containing protein [Nocardia sp. NPDC001965]